MWDAFVEMGIPEREECAGGDKDGICWVPASQHPDTGARSHAGLGHYLDVIDDRSNYDLLVGHKVTRLLFEDGTDEAPAVEFKPVSVEEGEEAEVRTVKPRLEVVVSAGAIHTPQILQRSGIAEAAFLEKAGIDVVVDLPGVGWNFQDHCGPSAAFTRESISTPPPSPLSLSSRKFRTHELTGGCSLRGHPPQPRLPQQQRDLP